MIRSIDYQHRWSINVRVGSNNFVIGFFDFGISSDSAVKVPEKVKNCMLYHTDGALAQYDIKVRDECEERKISTCEPPRWPIRSPDKDLLFKIQLMLIRSLKLKTWSRE